MLLLYDDEELSVKDAIIATSAYVLIKILFLLIFYVKFAVAFIIYYVMSIVDYKKVLDFWLLTIFKLEFRFLSMNNN